MKLCGRIRQMDRDTRQARFVADNGTHTEFFWGYGQEKELVRALCDQVPVQVEVALEPYLKSLTVGIIEKGEK